ncbi:hypothetical protein CF326_g66 [Tilletia indica]|nr:hypothetical protein CF326_g66 [Tilletia indica]
MGVKLLWPELDAAAQETTLEVLALSAFLHDGEVAAGTIDAAAGNGPQAGEPGTSRIVTAGAAPAKKYGPVRRHLVLGIDASIWLYHAMTMKHTAGHKGEVRMLFFRLAKLHSLPIIPIFVFDGPGRPAVKRNKQRPGAYTNAQYSFPHQSDFEKLIRLFGFAVYNAPAEAEAQLASMNADGVVDAILTDDGDAFLFGAQIVLRNSSKTLSGSQARANRLQRTGSSRNSDSDSGEPSQDSASSARSSNSRQRASRPVKQRKGKSADQPDGGQQIASDGDSDSRYTPSAESESSDKDNANSSAAKGKAVENAKRTNALQGKIEDSYTAYRSYLVFDGPRSHADERLFPARKKQPGSMFKHQATPNRILDRDGLILTALLSGGDYDVQGLARCGMKTAIALARCGFGKRLIHAFKKHFDPPAYVSPVDRPARQGSSSRQRWELELSAWVNDVQQELRSNSKGFMERKAAKLASGESWKQFLRTDQALEIMRSYIWPKVKKVTIHEALNQAVAEKRPFKRHQDGQMGAPNNNNGASLSAFVSAGTSSHRDVQLSTAEAEPPGTLLQANCDLTGLCTFAQTLFGWDAAYALKRFSSLLWDGCVLRRAISLILFLDQEREAGRPLSLPVGPLKGASPTKSKLTRRASNKSLGDVTITPQARRFADFFEKSVNIKTPQHASSSRAKLTSTPPGQQPAGANPDSFDLRPGDIHILAIHSTRFHVVYGGIASELRISYATDGLKKAVQSGLVSEWARGEDGMFAPANTSRAEHRHNGDSDEVDSVSDGEQDAGSNVEEDEEDELVTLSQVDRKKKAKIKVNDRRMWIPKVIIADLPCFSEPPRAGATLPQSSNRHSPMELVRLFEDAQRVKAENERLQAEKRASKTRTKQSKLAKPEAGQRSIAEFFQATSKGKGKARETPMLKLPAPRRQRPASSDHEFDSSMSESDDAAGARVIEKAKPSIMENAKSPASMLHIPSRFKHLQSPASGSDNSVIILDSPPHKNHGKRQELAASSAVSAELRPTPLSQTASVLSASEVDELVDEVPSQSSVAPPPKVAISNFFGGSVRRPAAEDEFSGEDEGEDEEEDDSLPDIFSQQYSQARMLQRKAQDKTKGTKEIWTAAGPSSRPSTIPSTRRASKSPDASDDDNVVDKVKIHRSPKKSPRKATTQLHAWSSGLGSSSKGQSSSSAKKEPYDFSSDESGDDGIPPGSIGARPASPSPLPKRHLLSARDVEGTQDTSASFEIVGEIRAKPRSVYDLDDSD